MWDMLTLHARLYTQALRHDGGVRHEHSPSPFVKSPPCAIKPAMRIGTYVRIRDSALA
jgi:hypothetical protein